MADTTKQRGRFAADDCDDAVDATIRRLTDERGSPLPRNAGAKHVQALHPTRTYTAVRARIRAVLPDVLPGPKRPRERPAGA
jgi:hypothetical protein